MSIADDIMFRIGAQTERFESGMNRVSKFARAAGAAIVASFSAGKIKDAVSQVAEIGKLAEISGIDVEAFQGLKYGAEQAKVNVEALSDGLKEMQLRADEFIDTGGGAGKEAFERLGLSSEQLAEKLKKPDALFIEILETLSKFDKAAQIRISDEIFGGSGGEQFVQILDQGIDKFKENIDEAKRLGLVFDKDVVESAQRMEGEYNKIVARMNATFQRFVVNAVSGFDDFFKNFGPDSGRNLSSINQEIEQLQNSIKNIQDSAASGINFDSIGQSLNDQKIKEHTDRLNELLKVRKELAGPQEYGPFLPPLTIESTEERERMKREAEAAARAAEAAGKRAAAISAREVEQITRVIEALQNEYDALSMTDEQKRITNELRAAGVDAASAEGQAIAQLVTMIDAEEAARENLQAKHEADRKRQEEIAEGYQFIGDSALDAAAQIAAGGAKSGVVLRKLAIDLAIAAAKAALLGQGPLAALFGGSRAVTSVAANTAFNAGVGGLFAKGGISNRPAIFGEAGPEAAVPLPDGRNIPVKMDFKNMPAFDQVMSGNGGGVNITNNWEINAPGADAAALARVEKKIDDTNAGMQRNVLGIVANAKSRRDPMAK